jgi:glycosyltransferase involved in cell wall biosynthesis
LLHQLPRIKKKEVARKYNLPKHFLLHIGNTDPRKNTARVLKAFYKYVNTTSENLKLVLIGINEAKLKSILKDNGLEIELADKIILTGYVSDDDLPVVFNLSEAFLFPSLREGLEFQLLKLWLVAFL